MMNQIATVYSDYSLTLAAVIFDPALIAAIDPHVPSSWALVFVLLHHGGGPQGPALLLSALHRLGLNGLT